MRCPLCSSDNSSFFFRDKVREFYTCHRCALLFVPPEFHLSQKEEKARYDLHQNDPDDPGYRKFLSRLLGPVREAFSPPARGLDFGCGPGPALSMMLEDAGYLMDVYDPYYSNHPEVLEKKYDFITCSEVVEHLSQPEKVMGELLDMLSPGGSLFIMTQLAAEERERFASWSYKNDITHICFFKKESFEYFATQRGCEIGDIEGNVICLRQPG